MSLHSLGARSWSTKLHCVHQRSAGDPITVFNNLGHILNVEMLADCFRSLDRKKAIGVDGQNKDEYGYDLKANLERLLVKIRRGTYRPQPLRIVVIPKEDGGARPLAISCFEDKIVQLAVARVLNAIYEPVFLESSYGFRPNRNAHDALRALQREYYRNSYGAVIEVDIKQYFNSIPLEPLEEMLRLKITDKRFMQLLGVLMRAPVLENGKVQCNNKGVPQGSICSPILANIYLHHVMDEWIKSVVEGGYLRGRCKIIRYADDFVLTIEYRSDAIKLYEVLPKRLARFGLSMHKEKSAIHYGGKKNIGEKGRPKPHFKFLGFEVRWIKARDGHWRPAFNPRLDRMNAYLREIKGLLRRSLVCKNHYEVLLKIREMVVGWCNYYAMSDCQKRINHFINRTKRLVYRWLNRRGGRGRVRWEKITEIFKQLKIPTHFQIRSAFHETLKKETIS